MKISVWAIGKTNEKYLQDGINKYIERIKHYSKIEYLEFKDVKPGQTPDETTKREAELFLSKINPDDLLVLMDEKGNTFDSISFSRFLEKLQLQSSRSVVFLIGGAFGHHELIRKRGNHVISMSKMTFSHQMARLFLAEQLYRAFTIIRNEKYHNS